MIFIKDVHQSELTNIIEHSVIPSWLKDYYLSSIYQLPEFLDITYFKINIRGNSVYGLVYSGVNALTEVNQMHILLYLFPNTNPEIHENELNEIIDVVENNCLKNLDPEIKHIYLEIQYSNEKLTDITLGNSWTLTETILSKDIDSNKEEKIVENSELSVQRMKESELTFLISCFVKSHTDASIPFMELEITPEEFKENVYEYYTIDENFLNSTYIIYTCYLNNKDIIGHITFEKINKSTLRLKDADVLDHSYKWAINTIIYEGLNKVKLLGYSYIIGSVSMSVKGTDIVLPNLLKNNWKPITSVFLKKVGGGNDN